MIHFLTDEELAQIPTGSVFIFDIEVYHNFFYAAFKLHNENKYVAFELSPDHTFNTTKLNLMLWRFCLVGFNSKNYDLPVIELAIKGERNEKLKEASDYIIKSIEKITPYTFEKKYKVKVGKYNAIDLIEVAPLQGSLKLYAGRLHCKVMQDLPYEPDHLLTKEEAEVVRLYCCNDLSNTELLFNKLAPDIKLRIEMSEEYGIDLRSKSDAQIAEAVINSELQKILGYYPQKPKLKEGLVLKYNIPEFVYFQSDDLKKALKIMEEANFYLDKLGSPIMPKEIEKLKVKIGSSTYNLSMGGLHSTEKKIAHYATEDIILADNDVESFYPRTILNQGLFPPHLGEAFLIVYDSIVKRRLDAKKKAKKLKSTDKQQSAAFKKIANSLKIVINGSFGKLGNKYSTLYAPQLMLQVTITGQLVLLMLIEALESINIDVVSGNTDGIICKYHKSRHNDVRRIIEAWEAHTSYKTEETRYKATYNRDVNSYIAVKERGDSEAEYLDERLGCKTKGAFCERGSALNSTLSKNPETLICIDAVLQYLVNKIPIEKTITECKDVRRFISVRNVKGGGEKNGRYLGKVVRWYYAKNESGFIAYKKSGNKVAKTDGAKPLMILPDQLPHDIDYKWYIDTAIDMLYDCGKLKKATTAKLF